MKQKKKKKKEEKTENEYSEWWFLLCVKWQSDEESMNETHTICVRAKAEKLINGPQVLNVEYYVDYLHVWYSDTNITTSIKWYDYERDSDEHTILRDIEYSRYQPPNLSFDVKENLSYFD